MILNFNEDSEATLINIWKKCSEAKTETNITTYIAVILCNLNMILLLDVNKDSKFQLATLYHK